MTPASPLYTGDQLSPLAPTEGGALLRAGVKNTTTNKGHTSNKDEGSGIG